MNGLIQIRGRPEDFDGWAAQGADGWDWAGVLPYFQKSQISVEKITQRGALVDAFIDAATDLGIPRNDDFNGPTQGGAGYLHLTTRNARRRIRDRASRSCTTRCGRPRGARLVPAEARRHPRARAPDQNDGTREAAAPLRDGRRGAARAPSRLSVGPDHCLA